MRYRRPMREATESTSRFTLAGPLLVAAALALSSVAFLGWVAHGPEIFLSLAENGLSWCF
jgi:hypothetical protein